MPNFAVIGLGTVGYYVARTLGERGLPVLGVDMDESRVDAIKQFVQKAVIADARLRDNLENLGLADMDAVVVCLGNHIEASVMVTFYLRELGVKEIIVRAVSEDHAKILNIIGASEIIFPERDLAVRVAERLENPNVLEYIPLMPGMGIVELAPPKSFLGKTLRELDLRNKYGVQVIIIKELVPERLVVIPRADHQIKESDILVVLGKDDDLERLERVK
jgi:trk system potassium uptake protein TrkA